MFTSKSVFCDGEPILLPPLLFGQNSIYQEVGEYLDVRHENGSFVVVSSESTRFTNDFMVTQGFPNWYMFA